ncbi:type 2 isopentenyl-diphosphate Delta-isomerase [Candidatus Micrarchaeota archaeon CG10_big_fil_rev_8_21_14_0_10_45_29]|nr:MAG: type 2 isopentenyl-diphosphate Delta-isomerase [Candidatus Micrarchaeota archaeon CG10_big_fil_rev_8_21_14_0_10_45_29]
MEKIDKRKDAHIDICLEEDVQYKSGAGFEDIELLHNALPEINMDEVNTQIKFLGKTLDAPFIFSAMTGGTSRGHEINKKLAKAAQEENIALQLGSSRPMLEDKEKSKYYKLRDIAPDIPIIANVGAAQLGQYDAKKLREMLDEIGADALAVHLNALQECVQGEGERDFAGVFSNISNVCKKMGKPVILKETGAGIHAGVAQKLFEAGAKYVESSGAGGSSWSKVEYKRGGRVEGFEEWGYLSSAAIAEISPLGNCIASGGLRSGIDVAKGICLGAKMGAAAMPFLRAEKARENVEKWKNQLKTAMFLCGAKDLDELSRAPALVMGRTAQILRLRGIDPAGFAQRSVEEKKKNKKNPTHYL